MGKRKREHREPMYQQTVAAPRERHKNRRQVGIKKQKHFCFPLLTVLKDESLNPLAWTRSLMS
jgi:hypothetical protein